MTPTQREAAVRLADYWSGFSPDEDPDIDETTTLLRELLAEPQGEPLAWMSTYPGIPLFVTHAAHEHPQSTAVRESYTIPLYTAPPQRKPQLHPTDIYDFAGWLTTRPGLLEVGSKYEAGPMAEAVGEYLRLYPEYFAAPPQRVPLTDEQVSQMRSQYGWAKETIRAIERAITGEPT